LRVLSISISNCGRSVSLIVIEPPLARWHGAFPAGDAVVPEGLAPPTAEITASTFTASQEQPGLRVKPSRSPIEVLVIDHI
jgi:uncharacterized protein (TIGR03435 family)